MLDPVRVSRRLSRLLRHRPQAAGLVLDAAGWVEVDALLAALARTGAPLTVQELERVVAANDKQRFELRDGRIRAQQGHSVPVDLGLRPQPPPEVLWHGTVEPSVGPILREGLRPGSAPGAAGRWSSPSTRRPPPATAWCSCGRATGSGWPTTCPRATCGADPRRRRAARAGRPAGTAVGSRSSPCRR